MKYQNKMKLYRRIIVYSLVFLFCLSSATVISQVVENDYQYRSAISLVLKPVKKLKLVVTPEMRFEKDLNLDKYHFESELVYKMSENISLGSAYRFIVNPRDKKETEYLNRYGLKATYKTVLNDFEPSFRLYFTNYADDMSDAQLLRYRAKLNYDIPDCKINPFIGIEAYHQLAEGNFYKMRYFTGFQTKLFKKNYLKVGYKFDYYLQKYKNRHVLGLTYKIKI